MQPTTLQRLQRSELDSLREYMRGPVRSTHWYSIDYTQDGEREIFQTPDRAHAVDVYAELAASTACTIHKTYLDTPNGPRRWDPQHKEITR